MSKSFAGKLSYFLFTYHRGNSI